MMDKRQVRFYYNTIVIFGVILFGIAGGRKVLTIFRRQSHGESITTTPRLDSWCLSCIHPTDPFHYPLYRCFRAPNVGPLYQLLGMPLSLLRILATCVPLNIPEFLILVSFHIASHAYVLTSRASLSSLLQIFIVDSSPLLVPHRGSLTPTFDPLVVFSTFCFTFLNFPWN